MQSRLSLAPSRHARVFRRDPVISFRLGFRLIRHCLVPAPAGASSENNVAHIDQRHRRRLNMPVGPSARNVDDHSAVTRVQVVRIDRRKRDICQGRQRCFNLRQQRTDLGFDRVYERIGFGSLGCEQVLNHVVMFALLLVDKIGECLSGISHGRTPFRLDNAEVAGSPASD